MPPLNSNDSWGYALAINGRDEIVGISGGVAVMWVSGIALELASHASAHAINDTNGIAGNLSPTGGQSFQAVLRVSGVTNVLTHPAGFDGSVATGINDAHAVVGFGGAVGFTPISDRAAHRALLWKDGLAYDLNDLTTNGSDWTLLQAWDINNHGQIVGVGELAGEGPRAFMLTPVPEPSRAWSMAFGMAVLLGALRGRPASKLRSTR